MRRNPQLNRLIALIVGGTFVASVLVVLLVVNTDAWTHLVGCYELVCDRDAVRELVSSGGWAAFLIFIGLQIGQVVLAPIPGDVTGFLGGYLFGALGGALLSTIGLTIGSMLNFLIGHYLGERVVRRIVQCEAYEKYNEMVRYKGVLVIFIFFLLPVFPKDYLCLFLGLTTMPAAVFFGVSTVGRLPGTIALSLQGASIFDKNYMFFVVVTALCVVFAIAAYLVREPFYRWMARHNRPRVCEEALPPDRG